MQDANIRGAKGLLVNISGPNYMTIELNMHQALFTGSYEDANASEGSRYNLKDQIHITVIATGLNDEELKNFSKNESRFLYQ